MSIVLFVMILFFSLSNDVHFTFVEKAIVAEVSYSSWILSI